jgi:hypothetical protein
MTYPSEVDSEVDSWIGIDLRWFRQDRCSKPFFCDRSSSRCSPPPSLPSMR